MSELIVPSQEKSLRSRVNTAIATARDDSSLLESLRQILSITRIPDSVKISLEEHPALILIECHGESIRIRSQSLEGRLLTELHKGKAAKGHLIEKLWPKLCALEQSSSDSIDNRLHRLVSRLNKKLPDLVQFDGIHYQLLTK